MTEALADKLIIVGNASDDPFAIDLAYAIGQNTDIADLISMKTFANGEFCPRFISDENDLTYIGRQLYEDGDRIHHFPGDEPAELAMRTPQLWPGPPRKTARAR